MREEIWTEKIFKDDAGYFLRITYIVLSGQCKSRHEEVNGRHNFVTVIRKKVAMQQIFKQLQQILLKFSEVVKPFIASAELEEHHFLSVGSLLK